MYVGRFVVVGKNFGGYCVCSRSFPNRCVVKRDNCLSIEFIAGAKEVKNPYVTYNCARVEGNFVVIGNGNHVDRIVEQLVLKINPKDALTKGLVVSGYEKDDHNTPRIAGIVGDESFIGIIRKDGMEVQEVKDVMFVSTYDKNSPERLDFEVQSAREVIDEMYGMGFEYPICAMGVKRGELVEFSLDNKKFN